MKKFLPKTKNNAQGFTLIELLVVIAIIGILAVVGFGAFSGVQAAARDSRVTAEIDALSKNVESAKDSTTGKYYYPDTKFDLDYTAGLTSPKYIYCHLGSDTVLPANPAWTATTWTTAACPTGWGTITGTTIAGVVGGSNDITDVNPNGVKYWKVCGYLERSGQVFCKSGLSN